MTNIELLKLLKQEICSIQADEEPDVTIYYNGLLTGDNLKYHEYGYYKAIEDVLFIINEIIEIGEIDD